MITELTTFLILKSLIKTYQDKTNPKHADNINIPLLGLEKYPCVTLFIIIIIIKKILYK